MMGMTLIYTSSNGNSFDLKVSPLRTRTANYHNFEWSPQEIKQQYGAKVYRFDRGTKSYETELSVFGSLEDKKTYLNILHAAFDHDIATMTPGRITHGMYYIECFITASSTYYEDPWTQNVLTIYCPYPFWRRDIDYNLKVAEIDEYDWLDFPFGFPYDYRATLPGYAAIQNPGVKPAEWQIKIKGYAQNPIVIIGDLTVGVNAIIGAGEELVISSSDKTIIKYNSYGIKTNLFNARLKDKSIFEPIPYGDHSVMWSGTFDIDLTIYEERSEPLWI